jgi:N-acetyl-gamma-glutamyl-phosphate reductase
MTYQIFIDGEAGTTGLQIKDRLQKRSDFKLVTLSDADRKSPKARQSAMIDSDAVILCLPDDAAREAVELCDDATKLIIDASTAHRIDPDWVYGLPELGNEHRQALKSSKRIANPGCYATAFVLLMAPLVRAGIVPPYFPISCHGVSGFSGGGRAMIGEYKSSDADPYRIYSTALGHKHLPEMTIYSGLEAPPLFTPAVANCNQGMIVEIPLPLWALADNPDIASLHEIYHEAYSSEPLIILASLEESESTKALRIDRLKNLNSLEIFVFGDVSLQQVRLVAVLDNLGKGASGAMVQNLNLGLGLNETQGLI